MHPEKNTYFSSYISPMLSKETSRNFEMMELYEHIK